jgi:ribosomal protein S24E
MMEILKEKEMKLLSRKRAVIAVENKGATPSRLHLLKEVAKHYKVSEDLIVIKHIYPQFGKNKTKVMINIYEDKAKLEFFEHANLLKRHKPKVEEKKE